MRVVKQSEQPTKRELTCGAGKKNLATLSKSLGPQRAFRVLLEKFKDALKKMTRCQCKGGAHTAPSERTGEWRCEMSFFAAGNVPSCCHGCRNANSTAQSEASSRMVDYEGERTLGGRGKRT